MDHAQPSNFKDILAVLSRLPPPDQVAAAAILAATREPSEGKRALLAWLARWQGRKQPRLHHARLSFYAAHHADGDSADRAAVAAQIQSLLAQQAPVCDLVAQADADLRLYTLNLESPTQDFAAQPAMSELEAVHAIAYGMTTIDPGLDLVAVAHLGAGGLRAAAVLLATYAARRFETVAGALGLDPLMQEQLIPHLVFARDLSPLQALRHYGGRSMAAMMGAMLAARMAHTPVVLSDWQGLAAVAVLSACDPMAARHVALTGAIAGQTLIPDLLNVAAGDGAAPGMAAAQSLIALRTIVDRADDGCAKHAGNA